MNQQFGVCNLSLVPVRAEPSDKSEMTSQLLFGDHFTIQENNGKWIRILTAHDEYEGWIDIKQFEEIEHAAFVALHDLNAVLGPAVSHSISKQSGTERLNLVAGSNIPKTLDKFFYLGKTKYKLEGETITPSKDKLRSGITEVAMFYLNAPYLWGGKSVFGIDCSGFTQMVFRQFGVKLKRDAYQQAEEGELVSFLQESRAGDLAFFDNDEGKITHVGIMLSNETIIHASGRVRIDGIDNQGIFNKELKRYTHKLRIIKRM
ncbi:MAG: C40 family peptidase [Daejeonella sp.]|uniref:C40 family peptidase n=1 Tax=Daejeonella sp. TaxID=2805397 RepID=UPI003C719D98